MRIAYFTNQYPAASHSFIRREIKALETLGVTVVRYALRSAPDELVDPEDKAEEQITRHILKAGIGEILRSVLAEFFGHPIFAAKAIALALKIGWRSDRGILRHLIYSVEAAVLASWCRRQKIDHLHAHFGTNSAAIAMLAHQFSNITYSFTAHGSEEFEKAILLSLDEKLHYSAFAVCVSSYGRSQLMRWVPAGLWPKIKLVHCGVDQAYLDSEATPPADLPRIVCVGRLCEHKAQLVLVAAASRLRDQGIEFELVLVGDGPMRKEVEEAIGSAGLEQQITITGWATGEEVKAQLTAARAFVLPSFSENMPVVIMEALALGRPVVSTYVAGIPEMVRPGKTGWLVPASDEAALAEALREVLDAPIDKLAAMGVEGRKIVFEEHDVLKEAEKLKKLFEEHSS